METRKKNGKIRVDRFAERTARIKLLLLVEVNGRDVNTNACHHWFGRDAP